MVFPIPRPVNLDNDRTVAPCGLGGEVPSPSRISHSELNNTVTLKFYFTRNHCNVYLGKGENPTSFPIRVGAVFDNQNPGEFKVPLLLKNADLKKGDLVTLQTVCYMDLGDVFQCSDIIVD
ncbi:hypothetical protein BC833DRAFT_569297 [Globomyces pollinis-pini]|nr:hypothetical protein BC833DRAFT_569297 [Globomyces pollinis-pini]